MKKEQSFDSMKMRLEIGEPDLEELNKIYVEGMAHLNEQLNNTWWKRLLNRLIG